MSVIEKVARAMDKADFHWRNLEVNNAMDGLDHYRIQNLAEAAIAALADGELSKAGRDAMRKVALNVSSTRRSGENGLRNDDELIHAYLRALKESV